MSRDCVLAQFQSLAMRQLIVCLLARYSTIKLLADTLQMPLAWVCLWVFVPPSFPCPTWTALVHLWGSIVICIAGAFADVLIHSLGLRSDIGRIEIVRRTQQVRPEIVS